MMAEMARQNLLSPALLILVSMLLSWHCHGYLASDFLGFCAGK